MPTYGADIATEEINITDGTTLLDALNKLIGDTVLWSDAVKWFNDGINELANYLEIETKKQVVTTAGILNYPIPADCQSIYKADLPFDTWGTDIILYGDPGDGLFNLYYYRKPLYLSNVYDVPADIPSNAHYALALYAAMRYKQSEEDFDQATEFEKAFEKKKALMVEYIKAKKLKESSGNTLLSSLNKLVGDIVLWDIAAKWFNDGINELTNELEIEATAQIETTSGTLQYPIPSDCLSIFKADLPFDTWENNIIFYGDPGSGIVNLYYYRKPAYVVNVQDLPSDIPVSSHYALVLYAAMRYKQSERDFDQALAFEKEFEKKKSLLVDYIEDKKLKESSGDTLLSSLNKLVGDIVLWPEAKKWLNDGINELTNELDIETTAQIVTIAGTLQYPIPSDCLSIVKADLPFDTWGSDIVFYGDPGNGTVKLYYHRKPLYIEGIQDYPEDIPEGSHYALILYAAMRYKQSKNEFDQALVFRKEFEQKKISMIQLIKDRKLKIASSDNTLLSSLNKLVEDVVLWDAAKEWFNDGISELTGDLDIETMAQIETVEGTLSYAIPSDCLSVIKAEPTFEVWGSNITFDEDPGDGTVDLYYYRKPVYLVNVIDLPVDIPVSSRYALVLYAAMRYKQSKKLLPEALSFEKAFEKKKDLMIDQVQGKVYPSLPRMVW